MPQLSATAGRPPFFLEKWYVDTFLDDGTLLIVLLGQLRLVSRCWARLSVELHRPDGRSLQDAASIAPTERRNGVWRFSGGQLKPGELTWRTPRSSGTLHLAPRHAAVHLRDPLLVDGRRQLRWRVEIPDADVKGRVDWSGEALEVRGRGYRDYLALDLLPWRLGARSLVWGRACGPTSACWWFELRTARATLAATWFDGQLTTTATPPGLQQERVIRDGPVLDIPALRIGWVRTVLRRLAGDPRQTRWVARSALDGDCGWAVWERVDWR